MSRRHVLFSALAIVALASSSSHAIAQEAAPTTPADMPAEIVAPATAAPSSKERAIFAVTDADLQKWNLTLGNIGNAIEGLGKDNADIELVVYGPAIVMLKKDSAVANKLAQAIASGVHVVACRNSMRGAHLESADLAPGVGTVPSGVVELIRREHAGYAYVRS